MKQILFLATVTILLLACKEGATPVSVPDIDHLLPPPPTQETAKGKSVDEKTLPVAEAEKSTFEPVDISACVNMLEKKGLITKSDYEYRSKGVGGSNTVKYSTHLRGYLKLFSYSRQFIPDKKVESSDDVALNFVFGREEIHALGECLEKNPQNHKRNKIYQFKIALADNGKVKLIKNTNIPHGCLKEYLEKVTFPELWLKKNEKYRRLEITVKIKKEYEYTYPFLIAAEKKERNVQKCLIEKCKSRKDVLNEMLILSAELGDTENIKTLVDAGAEVNAPSRVWMFYGSALFSAALNGQTEAIHTLLEKGADINATNGLGQTILSKLKNSCERICKDQSCPCQHEEMIKYLLAHGAQAEKWYFPPNTIDPFWNSVASKQLNSMKEPPLYDQAIKEGQESYRLLWLRSFHPPVIIKIEKNAEAYSLYLKVRDESCPGKLAVDKKVDLSEKDWLAFKESLTKANYWKLSEDKSPQGTDGSEWILEAKTVDRYHVVIRWSPDSRGESRGTKEFAELGLFILKLTGQTFEPIY
ncbi:MAG TPA: ankyrin repeat domain-containing protein [bacterium]|nr:ankyrin repeat domain-containing protein [bacterium]